MKRESIKMESLAQLKREAKNYTWKQVFNSWTGGELKYGHKLFGLDRKIIKQQSNALQFDGGSWLEWPKASELTFIHDLEGIPAKVVLKKIRIWLDKEKNEFMTYELSPINH